jgi:GT2 family glycosyltransferase
MKNPKILVAAPTYNIMEYCEKEFIDSIKRLDYSNYDILIVDNSKKDNYFNHLNERFPEIKIIKDNTNEEKNLLRLISSRNLILNYAIDNNYDYLLMIDSDVIPPKEAITNLLSCEKDLVCGLVYNYFKVDGQLKWLPVAWTSLTDEEFKKKVQLPSFIKSSEDLRAHMTLEEAKSNKLIKVLIPASGFMLISRNVFKKVKYGLLNTSEQENVSTGDDIFFILNAKKQGFTPYCFTKVKADHLIKGKFKQENGYYKHPMFR